MRSLRAAGLTISKHFDGNELITSVSHYLVNERMVIERGAASGAWVGVATGTIE